MSIQDAIAALINDRRDLTEDEATDALDDVFRGEATPARKMPTGRTRSWRRAGASKMQPKPHLFRLPVPIFGQGLR